MSVVGGRHRQAAQPSPKNAERTSHQIRHGGRPAEFNFQALSRLRASASAAALGKSVESRLVSVKSAPARLALDRSAPARSAGLRLQFARLAFCNLANSKLARDRLAPLRSASLRSAAFSTPFIRPIALLRLL